MKAAIIMGLILLLAGCANTDTSGTQDNQMSDDSSLMMPAMESGADTGNVRVFDLTGENYKFVMDGNDNPRLSVNVGDKVRVVLTSTQGFHDWKIDEFSAATDRVQQGQTASVEFVADKKGTFEYYCSVGQHRANGMWGYFVVQ